jgi:hypothetical protein
MILAVVVRTGCAEHDGDGENGDWAHQSCSVSGSPTRPSLECHAARGEPPPTIGDDHSSTARIVRIVAPSARIL